MTAPVPSRRLAIFARAPVRGEVKTRLARAIGVDAAFGMYQALLASTLVELGPGSGDFEPEVWVAGDVERFEEWQRRVLPGSMWMPVVEQRSGTLGQRMAHAFDEGISVLVGSDIPPMSAGYVARTLQVLKSVDVVLGPTEDGGYCLIAMNTPHPELFDGIPWSTSGVFEATVRAARELSVEVLEALWDVDVVADLKRWRQWQDDGERNPSAPFGR